MNDKSRPPLPKPVVFDPGRFGVAYSGEQMYEMFDLGWEMALKRLEQSAAQEPVAWLKDDGSDAWTAGKKSRAIESAGIGGANLAAQYNRPLYAAPVAQAQGPVAPNGYAYRYPDGIRFNDGHEVNGSNPIKNLTATPQQFARHLQRAARAALKKARGEA